MSRLNQLKTRAEVIDQVEALLQDSSNAIWTAAEIGAELDRCLVDMARYVPYQVRETLTTTADSRDLDISDITDLVSIEKVEYKTGEYPPLYRMWEKFGDTLTLLVADAPAADESVYLYCRKAHHLDADWVAATAYTVGDFVSPTTKNGYRYECTTAGTSGGTEPATWGTTAGGETNDNGTKWTCRAEKSHTLSPRLEGILVRWTACMVVFSKSADYINAVNQGGARASFDYQTWAQRELQQVIADLKSMGTPREYAEHPQ
ncbi:MAG: hypothetical protein JRE40_00885 [Deltaproteobacteria bacterium]|nr:hypothetical protein [Deltaproteobacteria bacterium]